MAVAPKVDLDLLHLYRRTLSGSVHRSGKYELPPYAQGEYEAMRNFQNVAIYIGNGMVYALDNNEWYVLTGTPLTWARSTFPPKGAVRWQP